MNYFDHLERRLNDKENYVPSLIGDKKYLRHFARMVGIATPELYYIGPMTSLELSPLPTEFVLKPSFASTSIGVLLLRRTETGLYQDLVTDAEYSEADIREKSSVVSERFLGNADSGDFMVEELLRDTDDRTPPADVRFYSFQGEIGLIIKEEHLTKGPTRAMYFDEHFLPFPDVNLRYTVAEKMHSIEEVVDAVTPKNWKALLAVAKRISVAVPSAFVRIDLYDTMKGIVLGELTFFPGTFFYRNRKLMSNSESERIGRIWDLAEERLIGSTDLVELRAPFKAD